MTSKLEKNTDLLNIKEVTKTKRLPPNAGKGRPKGVPNKSTGAIKEMILGALSDVGGQNYLAEQAQENPVAFMGLIGKVIPSEIKQQVEGALNVTILTGIPNPKDNE